MSHLPLLPLSTITAAATVKSTPFDFSSSPAPRRLTMICKFVYGSGGTTAKAFVQTSHDLGVTWHDIACFSFTTSTATKILSVGGATSITAAATATDGTLTADTALDGPLGSQFRVKLVSTGTYAGGTTIQVDGTLELGGSGAGFF